MENLCEDYTFLRHFTKRYIVVLFGQLDIYSASSANQQQTRLVSGVVKDVSGESLTRVSVKIVGTGEVL